MEAAATFIALVFVLYTYLTVVGYRCAAESGRMVARALGREVGQKPTFPQVFVLPFVLWISGLVAISRGERKHIARGAEMYLDEPKLTGVEKRKIREAVREYRRKYGLF